MSNRVFLTGLALGPAIALVLAPGTSPVVPLAIAISGAGSAYALFASLGMGGATTAARPTQNTTLLRPEALRDARRRWPAQATMRSCLEDVVGPNNTISGLSAPLSAQQAVATALSRVLKTWDRASIDALSDDEVKELHLFRVLISSSAETAGELADLFHRPDMMLDIRDEVARIVLQRERHDRQKATFDATWKLWQSTTRAGGPDGLLLSLQRLEMPDPDLWHKVVLEHDPKDPEQRAAALWCVRQRSCDRATVAAYLCLVAGDERLQAAGRRGDRVWLDAVLDVIEGWNAGVYKFQDIALSPVDMVLGQAAAFKRALDELSEITQDTRWPEPQGLFAEYHGRPAQSRDNWCLASGRLSAPPQLPDYVETRAVA